MNRQEELEKRKLEQLEASALTVMFTRLGSVADALAEKNVGSARIENLALIAVELGRKEAEGRFTSRVMASEAQQAEWRLLQESAVDEAEGKFAGIINHIVALRDGEAPAEEEED